MDSIRKHTYRLRRGAQSGVGSVQATRIAPGGAAPIEPHLYYQQLLAPQLVPLATRPFCGSAGGKRRRSDGGLHQRMNPHPACKSVSPPGRAIPPRLSLSLTKHGRTYLFRDFRCPGAAEVSGPNPPSMLPPLWAQSQHPCLGLSRLCWPLGAAACVSYGEEEIRSKS